MTRYGSPDFELARIERLDDVRIADAPRGRRLAQESAR